MESYGISFALDRLNTGVDNYRYDVYLSNAFCKSSKQFIKNVIEQNAIPDKKEKNKIIFYVKDNGIGIEHDDLGRLFEFGFKKRASGHGYGLHHSALVANEMNARLSVKSEGLDKGALFTLAITVL